MTRPSSSKLPRLSVVIPSYNQGQFIERTIRSIVDQNYPDLEIILMDGGSTDDTMEIVEKYRSHFAHIQSEPDGGQTAAIAAGFERATGEFISWLNSDDTYSPGALQKIGEYLAANPKVEFVYGDTWLIDASDNRIAFKRSARFSLGVMKYAFLTVPQMSAYWSRDLYHAVGGVDRALRFCMDYDLFVRMASKSAPKRIQGEIGNFRLHGDSKTSTMETVRQAEDTLVHDRYCAVKPSHTLAFRLTRLFWTGVLVLLLLENGSFFTRLSGRMRNNMQSECS
jgi:glycosyltransferase involved in cell wall biosynthesis